MSELKIAEGQYLVHSNKENLARYEGPTAQDIKDIGNCVLWFSVVSIALLAVAIVLSLAVAIFMGFLALLPFLIFGLLVWGGIWFYKNWDTFTETQQTALKFSLIFLPCLLIGVAIIASGALLIDEKLKRTFELTNLKYYYVALFIAETLWLSFSAIFLKRRLVTMYRRFTEPIRRYKKEEKVLRQFLVLTLEEDFFNPLSILSFFKNNPVLIKIFPAGFPKKIYRIGKDILSLEEQINNQAEELPAIKRQMEDLKDKIQCLFKKEYIYENANKDFEENNYYGKAIRMLAIRTNALIRKLNRDLNDLNEPPFTKFLPPMPPEPKLEPNPEKKLPQEKTLKKRKDKLDELEEIHAKAQKKINKVKKRQDLNEEEKQDYIREIKVLRDDLGDKVKEGEIDSLNSQPFSMEDSENETAIPAKTY